MGTSQSSPRSTCATSTRIWQCPETFCARADPGKTPKRKPMSQTPHRTTHADPTIDPSKKNAALPQHKVEVGWYQHRILCPTNRRSTRWGAPQQQNKYEQSKHQSGGPRAQGCAEEPALQRTVASKVYRLAPGMYSQAALHATCTHGSAGQKQGRHKVKPCGTVRHACVGCPTVLPHTV